MDLNTWISDKIMKLAGISEDNLVDFIKASAKKAKTPTKLLENLHKIDFPNNEKVKEFAVELFNKFPRKLEKEPEKNQVLELLKHNKKFEMVEKKPKEPQKEKQKPKEPQKEKRPASPIKSTKGKKIRKRDTEEKAREWEILDATDDELSELEEEISDRERDLRERDEFEQRLKDQDMNKPMQPKKIDQESILRKRMAEDEKYKQELIPSLREKSRTKYLIEREKKQLELLAKEVADEELLFRQERLTKREIRSLERKKKLLELRLTQDSNVKYDGYALPDEYMTESGRIDKKKQESVLHTRYEEAVKETSDMQQWEDNQIRKNVSKSKKSKVKEEEFDYVFDESVKIDFIKHAAAASAIPQVDHLPVQKSEAEKKTLSIKQIRESLPIFVYREQLLDAIEQFQTLIIVGETGSGKTTQLPQYLVECGYTKNGKKIGCTQPRRVAAMSVATRVSEEMGTKLGKEVGYSIRFEDCTCDKTIVKYMTDGMLLREFLTEPDLGGYSCLIIDEAHERTLQTDILFGLVKDIARFRPDLKLLISSATMDAEKFSVYFDDAPIFKIPGRKFPVDVYHTVSPEANYISAAITTIMTIHLTQDKGDILLFLTGQDEIETVQENLLEISRSLGSKMPEMIVCPIYANLPSEMQAKIFEPTPEGARKVILSTNIAETSITIDGIVYVIDPGFCKQNNYNPRNRMQSLVVVPTSRASADQRKGRAGRVGPGKCFRLYTSWAYQNELEENTIPEIQRTNMANTVLLLKSLGINDLMNFDFMDAPPAETVIRSLEHLFALGALNDRGELTKLGRKMAEFPIEPMLSKTLIAAEKYQCTEQVVTIVSIIAMLSVGNSIFFAPKDKRVQAEQARVSFFRPGGDHLMLLAVWDTWVETNYSSQWCYENFVQFRSMSRARSIREQLVKLMDRTEVAMVSNPDPGNTVPIRKAFTAGFFYNSARLQRSGDSYRTIKVNQSVSIHPSSSLYGTTPRWLLYFELVLTSREFMRECIEIEPNWLLEVASHYYKAKELEDDSLKKLPKMIK